MLITDHPLLANAKPSARLKTINTMREHTTNAISSDDVPMELNALWLSAELQRTIIVSTKTSTSNCCGGNSLTFQGHDTRQNTNADLSFQVNTTSNQINEIIHRSGCDEGSFVAVAWRSLNSKINYGEIPLPVSWRRFQQHLIAKGTQIPLDQTVTYLLDTLWSCHKNNNKNSVFLDNQTGFWEELVQSLPTTTRPKSLYAISYGAAPYPSTHNSVQQKTTLGQANPPYSSLGYISRADRMINRLGRIMTLAGTTHAAIALDGSVLVVSSNKISQQRSAIKVKKKLQLQSSADHIVNNHIEPILKAVKDLADGKTTTLDQSLTAFTESPTSISKTLKRDVKKLQNLILNKYEPHTHSNHSDHQMQMETLQLKQIKGALLAGLISESDYLQQNPGVYYVSPPKEFGKKAVQHGEMSVIHAIYKRYEKLKPTANSTTFIYVGGAKRDCYDCNMAHGIMNQLLTKKGYPWRIYTYGTHGGSFKAWKLSPDLTKLLNNSAICTSQKPNIRTNQQNYGTNIGDGKTSNKNKRESYPDNSDSEDDDILGDITSSQKKYENALNKSLNYINNNIVTLQKQNLTKKRLHRLIKDSWQKKQKILEATSVLTSVSDIPDVNTLPTPTRPFQSSKSNLKRRNSFSLERSAQKLSLQEGEVLSNVPKKPEKK